MPDFMQPVTSFSPARRVLAVTKNDTTVVNCRALWVGGAGDVAITAYDDTAAVTIKDVQAGTVLPIACKFVMATNTTATDIVALF